VPDAIENVTVREDGIRLGQLLKLAGLIDSGADAKAVLATGEVTVGGRIETRRGRQLRDGDVVALGGRRVRVVVPATG
jgi:ribosome-associated protein